MNFGFGVPESGYRRNRPPPPLQIPDRLAGRGRLFESGMDFLKTPPPELPNFRHETYAERSTESGLAFLKGPPPHLPVRKSNDMQVQFNKKIFTHCVFCKNNGEKESFYSKHTLKDQFNMVTCPILKSYVCPICLSTGPMAHTLRHCPLNSKVKQEQYGCYDERLPSGTRSQISELSKSLATYPVMEESQELGNKHQEFGIIGEHLKSPDARKRTMENFGFDCNILENPGFPEAWEMSIGYCFGLETPPTTPKDLVNG